MAGANFQLLIAEEALDQLRALPEDLRKRVGKKLSALEANFQGDIRKLAVQVYAVKDRKEAYE